MLNHPEIATIRQLKNRILELKLAGSEDEELKELLGSFVGMVRSVKEGLIIEKMNEMRLSA